jgi:hypothetical protein
MKMKMKREFILSRSRRVACLLLVVAGLLSGFAAINSSPATNPAASSATSKIAPWVIEQTENAAAAEFLVVLNDQADLSLAATIPTKIEKGYYVRNSLWNKSQATQAPIVEWLRERGIEHRSFYIVNAIG